MLNATFTREFVAVVVVFGVPYGLAVLVQDFVVPAVGHERISLLGILGLAAAGVVLGGVGIRKSRSVRRENRQEDDLACALAVAQADLQRLQGVIGGDLSGSVRRLVTITRWLRRGSENPPSADVTKRHLDELAAQAERIDDVVKHLAGRRPGRARAPGREAHGGALPSSSPRRRATSTAAQRF